MTLQLVDLSKRYGKEGEPALEGIDLTVSPGEFVAVLGRSGAGKSTLIRCINLLVRPSSGKVIWNGRDLTVASARELSRARREMGMIFQQFNLIGPLDVLTNVLVGAFPALPLWRCVPGLFPREAVDRAMEALERVGISHLARRKARELSGGQQQRVAIARALMLRPRIILGDEPVSNLDPVSARRILELLLAIHREENRITLLNLHDVRLAKAFATRIIGLDGGRIVFDGTPESLTEAEERRIYRDGVD
ncbi:phosphonate transport system ATP-binding protein [Planifilum fimeticola]|jgi:phosphonate transport system ATP-binding protein|uniref:Phosphonate transport system ATP-binding protein n=1 Tax=Planifilum fimeticola TaxID=201975 RepID=A0A2T0LB60_9BACL|nr:phosphonate ABC transporter ATP-binding protein [Planifilum fimeticola]PRX39071.1 phosphonate transport system ATP-binding protein [Planifilum fimeticola]